MGLNATGPPLGPQGGYDEAKTSWEAGRCCNSPSRKTNKGWGAVPTAVCQGTAGWGPQHSLERAGGPGQTAGWSKRRLDQGSGLTSSSTFPPRSLHSRGTSLCLRPGTPWCTCLLRVLPPLDLELLARRAYLVHKHRVGGWEQLSTQ